MKGNKWRKVIVIAVAIMMLVMTVVLAGCSSAPSSVKSLLKMSNETWSQASKKTITDEFSVNSATIIIPITALIIPMKINIIVNGASTKIVREIDGSNSITTFVVENIDIEPIKEIDSFIKINYAELKNVKISGRIAIDADKLVADISVTNMEKVLPDSQPVEDIHEEFTRAEHGELIAAISNVIGQSLFGNPASDGTYSKKSMTYGYKIPIANANAELFKMFKILLDVSGDMPLEGDTTINSQLKSIFGTSDLIAIIDSIIKPTGDLAVNSKILQSGNKYYLGEFNTVYNGNGSLSKARANKILDLLKKTTPELAVVNVSGNVSIEAVIYIKTTQNIIK